MAMFNPFYSLAFNPFDKQQVKESDAFISHDYKEMLSRLDYLKEARGIGLFTSPPGRGKSFCLRCFSKRLNPSLYHMEYMPLSTITVAEFYKELCTILGVSDKGGKPGRFRAIQEQIYYLYHEKRQPLLLAIDEAQFLSTSILNDIKMLMNQKYDSVNCFTLILCGESSLNHMLSKQIHEALRQRITVHYDFHGLSDEETVQYVIHKLASAGSSKAIIEEAALLAVAAHSHGNARIIDSIMTDALNIGVQEDKKRIDTDVVMAAVSNQNLG